MPERSEDILSQLERCITLADSAALNSLFSRFRRIAYRVFNHVTRKTGRRDTRAPDFFKWFKGWVWENEKLNAVYVKLLTKVESGEVNSPLEQEKFFDNYFARVARSGVVEYYRELEFTRISRHKVPPDDTSVEPAVPECYREHQFPRTLEYKVVSGDVTLGDEGQTHFDIMPSDAPTPFQTMAANDIVDVLRRVFEKLDPKYVVPFVLKSKTLYSLLRLADVHLGWLSEQSGLPADELAEYIETEFHEHQDGKYPLSSGFIAALMGIMPDTVDQRARRARKLVRDALKRFEANGML